MALPNDKPPPRPGVKMKELHRQFCLMFISGLSREEAYKLAGGTSKTPSQATANILKRQDVQDYIELLMERTETKAIMDREEALGMLTNIARAKITDVIAFHEVPRTDINGNEQFDRKTGEQVFETIWTIKNIAAMTPEIAAIVKGISNTANGTKMEIHDQVAALKQLAAMEGWDAAQKYEHTGKDGGEIETRITRVLVDPAKGETVPE